jgi:hypothetical protein
LRGRQGAQAIEFNARPVMQQQPPERKRTMRRPAIDVLRDLRGGAVIEELDAALQALVMQVQSTLKGGALTLKVEVKPLKGSAEAVIVRATVESKAPTLEDVGVIMFPSPEGNLTRSHFRQPDLPGLAAVDAQPVAKQSGVA